MDHREGPHLQREERDVALVGARVQHGERERARGAGGDRHRRGDPQPAAEQRHGDRRCRSADAARAGSGACIRACAARARWHGSALLMRSASIGAAASTRPSATAACVIRMAAPCRRIPLALTRSTPCFGSASSPRSILVVAINVALLYALRRSRAERGTEPRQVTGGRGIQIRVGAVLAAFAAVIFVLGIVYTTRPARRRHRLRRPPGQRRQAAGNRSDRPAVAMALRLPERSLHLLQAGRPGRHRGRPRPRLDRRRPHLGRPRRSPARATPSPGRPPRDLQRR